MVDMFSSSKFNGDISKWATSEVTDMGGLFCNNNFNGDISNWNFNKEVCLKCIFLTIIKSIWILVLLKKYHNGAISQSNIEHTIKLDHPEYFI
jgi:surface protein